MHYHIWIALKYILKITYNYFNELTQLIELSYNDLLIYKHQNLFVVLACACLLVNIAVCEIR